MCCSMKRFALVSLLFFTVLFVSTGFVFSEQLTWRLQVVMLKLDGRVDDISWSELLQWMAPGSPIYLQQLLVYPAR